MALGCALFVVLASRDAGAYCRTTTCDPKKESCQTDGDDCIIEGMPLWWRDGRMSMWVDAAGAPLTGITSSRTAAALASALDAWSTAICADGSLPALETFVAGELSGAQIDFDLDNLPSNRNVVLFEETDWPHAGNIVALTSTTFDTRNGQILDADTELNAEDHLFGLDLRGAEVDLLAVLTHETGHALGLDHTNAPDATMQPETPGFAFVDLRTLAEDDVNGICAIYPRDTGNEGCACATPSRAGVQAGQGWLLLVAGLIVSFRRSLKRSRSV